MFWVQRRIFCLGIPERGDEQQLFSYLCKIFHTSDVGAMRKRMRNVGQAGSAVFKKMVWGRSIRVAKVGRGCGRRHSWHEAGGWMRCSPRAPGLTWTWTRQQAASGSWWIWQPMRRQFGSCRLFKWFWRSVWWWWYPVRHHLAVSVVMPVM